MDSSTINAIRSVTLRARELLTQEASEQLEGLYGWLPDGSLEPMGRVPVLQELPELAETRRCLETYLAEEKQMGHSPRQARDKLVREAAFTWLNRAVAIKMMEARKLVRETISRGMDSDGFKLWLTEPGNEEWLADYERGELPQDARGEGPRHRAYRKFLLAQCAKLAGEIRVLFDPENLASRLFPRPRALQELIGLLSAEELREAWRPHNEETIGWVYQAFNSEELEKAFREVRVSGKKFEAEDIPTVTQLFTPRWIVRFLVENTLGRLWLEMHPDSRLLPALDYLVPLKGKRPKVALKSVREIKLLDPACGTMHFGLVAFDLFVEMYREEMERAGEPGWPEEPPVEREEDIPAAVIANNIHGIDIDLRAVQLSALTLYLKAKSLYRDASLRESRLAWANVHMLDGQRLREFLDDSGIGGNRLIGRVLRALQRRLSDAEQLGSLIALEDDIRQLVEQERRRLLHPKSQLLLFREAYQLDAFEEAKWPRWAKPGTPEFWETLEIQVGEALDEFAREQAAKGRDQSFFAKETTKGLRFLDIVSQRYDVVVTNPPYMSSRKMNERLKNLVGKAYPEAKGDLYAAFVQRCLELAGESGRVGMLTMHSFMFISSYEKLRGDLRSKVCVETLVHAGPALFSVGNPGTLQTAAYVLRREPDPDAREGSVGTYFRLVKELSGEAKRQRFEHALVNLRQRQNDPAVYRYRQGDFDAIPGSPWVYWITPGLRRIFETFPKLGEVAQPRQGLATADNFRFLRYWWEVGTSRIAFGCRNREEALACGKRWFPYVKGGSFRRWYGNQEYVVNWWKDGAEIRTLGIEDGRVASRPQNVDYYFRRGVTWSALSSAGFSARLMQDGFIIGHKGPAVYAHHTDELLTVLGVLNSRVIGPFLSFLSATIDFNVGQLALLPFPRNRSQDLCDLVWSAVQLALSDGQQDESTWDFVAPPAWPSGLDDLIRRRAELARLEREIDEEVYRLYGISDEDRRAIEAELVEQQTAGADPDDEVQAGEGVLTREELAKRWVSYAVGVVFGRFQPGVEGALGGGHFDAQTAERLRAMADPDGVLVLDEGHPDDLPVKVFEGLRIMHGEDAARKIVRAATGGEGEAVSELRRYLGARFFKEHIQRYRKRPVYWLLQSPRKKYGVWLFHEKLTKDTLYRIRGEQYVDSKIKLLEAHISELRKRRESSDGRERRRLEAAIAELEDLLDDVRELARRLDAVLQRGYTPHIDDGVLINMAPLWELIPSWQSEPKKCWEALERGDYDWSHQAMDHWPERVLEKCKRYRSYAIAHGLEDGAEV